MKNIIICESDLDLYCEVKLLNEYNKFLAGRKNKKGS